MHQIIGLRDLQFAWTVRLIIRLHTYIVYITNYTDAKLIAELSSDLGEAMVGINEQEIELLMAERGI